MRPASVRSAAQSQARSNIRSCQTGHLVVVWDGRNQQGRRVSAGHYWVVKIAIE